MYPIAHIVAASGAAWSAERVAWRVFGRSRAASAPEPSEPSRPSLFDFRLVAAGSWLPDAIDKPMAWLFLRSLVEDDHLLAHTLVFGLVLAVPSLYLAWRGKSGLISLTAGVMAHRMCDPMWPEAETVLWPFYGWTFEHSTTPYFPVYLVLEVVAAVVLWRVLRRLWLRDRMWPLVLDGRI